MAIAAESCYMSQLRASTTPLMRLHACSRGTMSASRAPSGTILSWIAVELGDMLAPRGLGRLDGDRLECDLRADRQPAERRQVGGDDRRDLRIAAGGLAVGQQHDRLAVAGHLDRARRDAVGGDVEAAECRSLRPVSRMPMRSALGPTVYSPAKKAAISSLREIVVLRAGDRAEARRRAEIEAVEPASSRSLALARGAAAAGRPRSSARPCQPPMPPRMIGRDAAEHGRDVEAALDRDIEHGAAGQRADADDFAAAKSRMLRMPRRGGPRSQRHVGENLDRRLGADNRDPHVVGLDRQRRAEIGDFQRAGTGRIADQQIGGMQADRIERAAHRDAEVLIAGRPRSWIVVSRPGATTRSAGFMRPRPRCRRRQIVERPSAACASRSSYSRNDTGAKPTLSPGASSARGRGRVSHSGTGERPMRCQPHGVSSGKMQVMVIAIASEPARDRHSRSLAPRQRELGRHVAHIGLARQEAEHVDVIGGARCAARSPAPARGRSAPRRRARSGATLAS